MKKRKIIYFILLIGAILISNYLSQNTNTFINKKVTSLTYNENNITNLTTPENLLWKENSTATATWTKVTNANYYQVYVYVYSEDNLIGSTITGTSDTEIDLQHEINKISQNLKYEKVQVKFKVVALYIDLNSDNNIESNESSLSDIKEYLINIAIPLETPTNLNFSNTYEGTWNYDLNTYYFDIEFKFTKPDGTTKHVSSIVYTASANKENPFTYNLETYLENAYKTSELTNTNVKVAFRIKSKISSENSKNYKNSNWSEWSNEIDYYNNDEIIKFLKPTNLNLENTLIGSWDFDKNADYYWVKFKFKKSDGTTTQYESATYLISTRTNKENNETFLANLRDYLLDAYRKKKLLGTNVKVSFSVKADIAVGSTKNYKASDWSEWSNEIDYYNDVELIELLPPTRINLTDTFDATWTFDENAYFYNVRFKFIKSDGTQVIYDPLGSNFPSTESEELFTRNIKTFMEESYNEKSLSPEPVLVSFSVQSYALSENTDYTNSKFSEWSNEVIYNPNNYPLVEKITLSPAHTVIAKGKSLYIGKTITPEDGYYSKLKWTSDDKNTVKIDADGKITGLKAGTTKINGSILNAKGSALVSVYEINSNLEDRNQNQALVNDTVDIINEIMLNKNADKTDITNINDATEKIENGAKNNNKFHIDLKTQEKTKEDYNDIETKIKEKYSTMEILSGFDINLELYHELANGEKNHIANITEVKESIDLRLELPTDIPPLDFTKNREYYLVKYHNNEFVTLDANINNGIIKTSSNEFSDFILLYEDTDVLATGINVYNLPDNAYVGDDIKATVEVQPINAANKNYTVKSSDTSVIIVENNIIKPVGPGTATITFTTEDGNFSTSKTITVSAPLQSISLSQETAVISKGETLKLEVIYNPTNTTDNKDVTWTSSDESIATVNNGVVRALKHGFVTITAKVGEKEASSTIEIKLPLENISLNKTEGTLNIGESETLTVTYNPDDTTDDKTVTWTSSDESIATVNNGVVRALKHGFVTITAKVGEKEASSTIEIKLPLENISLNKTEGTLNIGESETLTVTYNPDDTTDDKTVTWTSSDESIATVENGIVQAVGRGLVTITATVKDKTAEYKLTVKKPLIKITINKTADTLNIGESETLTITYNPDDTTDDKTVTWTSSDESIATVNNGVVRAIKPGSVTITAKVGEKEDSIIIEIKLPLESISLNKTEGTLNIGDSETLTVTYNPDDTTDNKDVTWMSSDENIATVKDGVITAVNKGTVTITATVGNKTATYKLEVKDIPLISISLNKTEGTLNIGESETLTVTYNPTNTTDNKDVTWMSSDENIATVNNGVITAVNKGSATITATVGNKTATYKLTVTDDLTLYKMTTQKGYKVQNNFIHGFNIGDNINDIKTKLGNNIIINGNHNIIATGSEISYKNEKLTVVIYGDITGDGIINSADLLKMRQHLLGTINLNGPYKEAASIVNKTTINSADLLKLRQHLLGTNTIIQ